MVAAEKQKGMSFALRLVSAFVMIPSVFVSSQPSFVQLDNSAEYIMVYENGQDAGVKYESGTAEFQTYFDESTVQTFIANAEALYKKEVRSEDAIPIVDNEVIANWNEAGYIYPWANVTEEDEALVPVVENLYNTDGDFTGVPNIVFIMLDDLGWNDVDLGMRSSNYEGLLPNINKLVKDGGITLTNYLTGAICTPARGMFLTSRYASILNMEDNFKGQLKTEDVTLAHELKSAGYSTALIGKYGVVTSNPLVTPKYKGFDYSYGFYASWVDKWTRIAGSPLKHTKYTSEGFNGSFVDLWDDGEWVGDVGEDWLPDVFLEKAMYWFTSVEDTDNPFFLYFASDLPHGPFTEPADRYDGLCSSQDEDLSGVCQYMLAIDDLVGDLVCHVEQMGKLDNTLFVFASDNGAENTGGNVPFYGKKEYMSKGGYSGPAAIFGDLVPDALRGTTNDNMFHVTDWTPTLMHAATRGTWKGAMDGTDINGVDQWGAVMEADGTAPRTDAMQYMDSDGYMNILVQLPDGTMVSYNKGTAWCDVLENTEGNSYDGPALETTVCLDTSSTFAATQLESASALLQKWTRHSGAASDATRFMVVMVGVLAVVILVHKSRASKWASMGTDADANLISSDMPRLSYGAV